MIAIPPTESSFTRYFPQIPSDTDVIYHVMVGPAVLTFVKELGEFYGGSGPKLFGFIDSLEAVDIKSPGLEFLEGSHFWEGAPRYLQANASEHEKAYPEWNMFGAVFPAYGIFARHVQGMHFEDVTVTPAKPDARPAVVLIDVQNLTPADFGQSPK